MVTVEDLGILRDVVVGEDGSVTAKLSPTYSGCPAVSLIEMEVETALLKAGFDARVERVISPAWTTDWITDEGRRKLIAAGIAPPVRGSASKRALFDEDKPDCPRCGSHRAKRISEFGATACKALYQCDDCHEPFEYFKCI